MRRPFAANGSSRWSLKQCDVTHSPCVTDERAIARARSLGDARERARFPRCRRAARPCKHVASPQSRMPPAGSAQRTSATAQVAIPPRSSPHQRPEPRGRLCVMRRSSDRSDQILRDPATGALQRRLKPWHIRIDTSLLRSTPRRGESAIARRRSTRLPCVVTSCAGERCMGL